MSATDPIAHAVDPAPERLTALQRRRWSRRASTWDHEAERNPGLVAVARAVVDLAGPGPGELAADLGAGTGLVTIPLARSARSVVAVDLSPAMIDLLRRNLEAAGIGNVACRVHALEDLDLPEGSLDVVVTSYTLHHLSDAAKAALVRRAHGWLRPGGRLVIGDMMFGRGADPRDRAIIRSKVWTLFRKGPGGLWRIAKNAWRFIGRTSERPLPMHAWVRLLEEAGFDDVVARPVVAEAAVVRGVRRAG